MSYSYPLKRNPILVRQICDIVTGEETLCNRGGNPVFNVSVLDSGFSNFVSPHNN